MMRLVLASVQEGGRRRSRDPEGVLVEEYRSRASRYQPCETFVHGSTEALLHGVEAERRHHATQLVLLDSGGELLNSRELASRMGRMRDGGVQVMIAAVGPADGWSRDTLARADMVLSFGPLTLPHRLAQVILAEQVYRALTILAGHPYHCGH